MGLFLQVNRKSGSSPRRAQRSGHLAADGPEAENESVPIRTRFAVLLVALLALYLAAAAQYQDRDTSGAPKTSATAPPPAARIDINHSSATELLKIPGMTPSWAGRIVRFRPYRTKQDLLDRGVLPSEVYDRIKDYVIAHRDGQ
jgi:competence protein ComEA